MAFNIKKIPAEASKSYSISILVYITLSMCKNKIRQLTALREDGCGRRWQLGFCGWCEPLGSVILFVIFLFARVGGCNKPFLSNYSILLN